MTNKLLFTNAHLICPEQGLDGNGWLATEGDKITAIGKGDNFSGADKNAELIDCKGDILAPGLPGRRISARGPRIFTSSLP